MSDNEIALFLILGILFFPFILFFILHLKEKRAYTNEYLLKIIKENPNKIQETLGRKSTFFFKNKIDLDKKVEDKLLLVEAIKEVENLDIEPFLKYGLNMKLNGQPALRECLIEDYVLFRKFPINIYKDISTYEKFIAMLDNRKKIAKKLIDSGVNPSFLLHHIFRKITDNAFFNDTFYETIIDMYPENYLLKEFDAFINSIGITASTMYGLRKYVEKEEMFKNFYLEYKYILEKDIKILLKTGNIAFPKIIEYLSSKDISQILFKALEIPDVNLSLVFKNLNRYVSTEKNANGETLLFRICTTSNLKALITLLDDQIFDLNIKDSNGQTALHWSAISRSSKEIIEFLYDKGALLNIQDNKGETPLHLAIKCDSIENLETLIKKGANIDVKDNKGQTALHVAILSNNKKIIQLLLEAGADINIKDSNGRTVKDLAQILNSEYNLNNKGL